MERVTEYASEGGSGDTSLDYSCVVSTFDGMGLVNHVRGETSMFTEFLKFSFLLREEFPNGLSL